MSRLTGGPWPAWEIVAGSLYQRGTLANVPQGQGTLQRGLVHFGITVVVQLAPREPDLRLAELLGDGYVHMPIPDGKLPALVAADLAMVAVDLAAHIEAGGAALSMCRAGRNRSGLLSALVVRELSGIPGRSALQVVRQHRPGAVDNAHFEAYLEALA